MIAAAVAARWLFSYFIFMTGPSYDPGDPVPCMAPACSAFTIAPTQRDCEDQIAAARAAVAETGTGQIVAVCVEIGPGVTAATRALSEAERRKLELDRARRKSDSAS